MPSLIEAFKDDSYRIGDAQAIPYDRTRTAIFPEGFLAGLYVRLKGSRFAANRPESRDTLEALFCGMTDTSFDAIVAYLAKLPLIIMGVWDGDDFEPAGFCFPSAVTALGDERMCFGAYALFRKWWGTDEATALVMLGICAMFGEWKLLAIHGTRYDDNYLTARFLKQFGFKDVGKIDRFLLRRGKLSSAITSSLMREEFEDYLQRALIAHYSPQKQQGRLFTESGS